MCGVNSSLMISGNNIYLFISLNHNDDGHEEKTANINRIIQSLSFSDVGLVPASVFFYFFFFFFFFSLLY